MKNAARSKTTTRKKIVKFRHQFDPEYNGVFSDIKFGKSVTVPDQNLTVQQLMLQHTRGLGTGQAQREEMYLDEMGMEIKRPTDLVDLQEYREELQERQREIEEQIAKETEQQQTAETADKSEETSDKSSVDTTSVGTEETPTQEK